MKILNKRRDPIPEGAVYVGRPSPFGNPFVIGKDGTREEVVGKYRRRFEELTQTDPEFVLELEKLRSATGLVCWCAPLGCHASVIAEYLEKTLPGGTKS